MSVGFTGARTGTTTAQRSTATLLLGAWLPGYGPYFYHGKARGADLEIRDIAVALGYKQVPFPAGDDPLARNRVIVNKATIMIATPDSFEEIKIGSGTWMTIRYANAQSVPGITIWPDGTCSPMTRMRKE